MERFSTLSSFMQLVSGRDRTQTQAVQLQNHPPSPLPPAQCSPPHSALVHTELWIPPAHGMLTPTLLSPRPQGERGGRLPRSRALPHHYYLCADLTVLRGEAEACLPQPNPTASPASRGSCLARRTQHTASWRSHASLRCLWIKTPVQLGHLAGTVSGA